MKEYILNQEAVLNTILDKILLNGLKSLTTRDRVILDRISKGESLEDLDDYLDAMVSDDPNLTPRERFSKALCQSGYEREFKKIYGTRYATKGNFTGWFISDTFVAYMEFEDKRVGKIYDNISDMNVDDFNEMMETIVMYLEIEFNSKYTIEEYTISNEAKKHNLDPLVIEFIIYK